MTRRIIHIYIYSEGNLVNRRGIGGYFLGKSRWYTYIHTYLWMDVHKIESSNLISEDKIRDTETPAGLIIIQGKENPIGFFVRFGSSTDKVRIRDQTRALREPQSQMGGIWNTKPRIYDSCMRINGGGGHQTQWIQKIIFKFEGLNLCSEFVMKFRVNLFCSYLLFNK